MKQAITLMIVTLFAGLSAIPAVAASAADDAPESDFALDECSTSIPGLVECVNELAADAVQRYGQPTVQYVLTMCKAATGKDCIRATPASAGNLALGDFVGIVGCDDSSIPGIRECVFYLTGDAFNRYGAPTVQYVMTMCKAATGKDCVMKTGSTDAAGLVADCDTSIPGLVDCATELAADAKGRYGDPTIQYVWTMCAAAAGKDCRSLIAPMTASATVLGCDTSIPGLVDCAEELAADAVDRYGGPTIVFIMAMCEAATGDSCTLQNLINRYGAPTIAYVMAMCKAATGKDCAMYLIPAIGTFSTSSALGCDTSVPGIVDCAKELAADAVDRYGGPTIDYVMTMCEAATGGQCRRIIDVGAA